MYIWNRQLCSTSWSSRSDECIRCWQKLQLIVLITTVLCSIPLKMKFRRKIDNHFLEKNQTFAGCRFVFHRCANMSSTTDTLGESNYWSNLPDVLQIPIVGTSCYKFHMEIVRLLKTFWKQIYSIKNFNNDSTLTYRFNFGIGVMDLDLAFRLDWSSRCSFGGGASWTRSIWNSSVLSSLNSHIHIFAYTIDFVVLNSLAQSFEVDQASRKAWAVAKRTEKFVSSLHTESRSNAALCLGNILWLEYDSLYRSIVFQLNEKQHENRTHQMRNQC